MVAAREGRGVSADGSLHLPLTGKTIRAADLFCGAGGTSSGARRAVQDLGGKLKLVAVNHWDIAIQTHTRMHPDADHLQADLEHVRPLEAVPGGVLDILMASPTCTYHSRARGGRPVNDQQRMDPWHVVRWCTELRVHRLLVENVPEFTAWGPCSIVTGRPIPSRRGEYFRAWLNALEGIGYRYDWKVINCADNGDATTRERFFLIARSDRKPLRWPEPRYTAGGGQDLLGSRQPWRGAWEIIDWSIKGTSIFRRPKPLKPNTVRRILAGAIRYNWPRPIVEALQALLDGREPILRVPVASLLPNDIRSNGDHGQALVLDLRGTEQAHLQATARDIERPLTTITANGNHHALVMSTASGGVARSVDDPVPTIVGGGNGARPHLMQPLVMGVGSHNAARGVEQPLPTITTGGGSSEKRPGNARPQLIEPLIAPYYGGGSGLTSKPVSEPLPAATTKARFGLAQPVMIRSGHGDDGHTPEGRLVDPEKPLPTITGSNEFGIAEPLVVTLSNSSRAGVPRPVSQPINTITTAKGGDKALAEPAMESVDGFVDIDVLYRMLKCRELARAMSFDDDGEVYNFAGNNTEITKQIGNAVPVRTAKALVKALLEV